MFNSWKESNGLKFSLITYFRYPLTFGTLLLMFGGLFVFRENFIKLNEEQMSMVTRNVDEESRLELEAFKREYNKKR